MMTSHSDPAFKAFLREYLKQNEDGYWLISDIAEYLQMSEDTVRRKVRRAPNFPAPLVRIGKHKFKQKRYPKEKVKAWINQQRSL
jgi:predicted DNA-binding transcriptional regulator AlpA